MALKQFEVTYSFFVMAETDGEAKAIVENYIGAQSEVDEDGDEPGVYDVLCSGEPEEVK